MGVLLGPHAAPGLTPGNVSGGDGAGFEAALGVLLGPHAAHPLLSALAAAVRGRVAALAGARAAASGAAVGDDRFDVFG